MIQEMILRTNTTHPQAYTIEWVTTYRVSPNLPSEIFGIAGCK